jgi:hypothetical protein
MSTSWSQSKTYQSGTISVLADTNSGQTSTANAYLTTGIGPGTTSANEIAHTQFTVPSGQGPVCSPASCGFPITLFSGLSLGPGNYFLTLGLPSRGSSFVVGWFPVFNPTVVEDMGVSVSGGDAYIARPASSYAPASVFAFYDGSGPFTTLGMDFTVTTAAVPEPGSVALIGLGVLFLLVLRLGRSPRIEQRSLRFSF